MDTKRCTKCGKVKPMTEFSPAKQNKDGRRSWCKACSAEDHRRYHAEHREKCNEYGRRYYVEHREERIKYNYRWQQENPEKVVEQHRRYYEKHREEIGRQTLRWQREHPEKVAEYARLHKQRYPEKNRERARIRRARKAGAEGSHAHEEFIILCELVGWKCLYCGKPHTDFPLTEDHIVPISRGGSDDISNIQPLCQHCNSVKGIKDIDYWQDPWWACVT